MQGQILIDVFVNEEILCINFFFNVLEPNVFIMKHIFGSSFSITTVCEYRWTAVPDRLLYTIF
jgi:hypothetical protein